MRAGDVYVLNAPYDGGTHLPDITVDHAGVRRRADTSRLFYVGRAAIMPISAASRRARCRPTSTHVDEEGVLIDNVLLVDGGRVPRGRDARAARRRAAIRRATSTRTSPICGRRSPPAQKGAQELRRMVAQFGRDVVRAYMRHVQDNAEEAVRRVIGALKDGSFRYEWTTARRSRSRSASIAATRSATIDFTGTSAQLPEQLQRAVGGLQGGGALRLPHPGRRRHPAERGLPEAAVGHRSRRLDAQSALSGRGGRRQCRDSSASPTRCTARSGRWPRKGTMNNFTFGNARYQYYETIAGGAGAGPDFDGAACGADAHDQLPPDRSRGAGMALSGAARIAMIRADRAAPGAGTAATGRSGASAFSRR